MASKELEALLSDLDPKQAMFLRGLMSGKTQRDAYQEAYGCGRESAESSASRLLRNDRFRPVYEKAMAECFDGLIDGLKEMSPIVLRRIREILVGENEAVVVRLIDSILDRTGVVRTERREHSIEDKESVQTRLLASLEAEVPDRGEGIPGSMDSEAS